MDLQLDGRAVLITGGTDGLGLALARRLTDEGAGVAVCGRDPSRLASAQRLLGGDALCVQADVTNGDDLEELVAATRRRFGRIDGVVNNAGRSAAGPVASTPDDSWRDDYELKVVAAAHLIRLTLDDLAAVGGSVLNVLAVSAKAAGPQSVPTSASRAAGLALTKSLAGEVGPRGVRVNAILIGVIESGQWVRAAHAAGVSVDELYASMGQQRGVPLGRVGRAEEFADVAAFLLSPRASYVTGTALNVDGGLSPVV